MQCGENRHTDIANLATLIHTKKWIHCVAIFTILYGNYYPPRGQFKLICIRKFARRTWVNFNQQYGKNRERCQQNTYYFAVWQLLLYFYREFPSKILSVWLGGVEEHSGKLFSKLFSASRYSALPPSPLNAYVLTVKTTLVRPWIQVTQIPFPSFTSSFLNHISAIFVKNAYKSAESPYGNKVYVLENMLKNIYIEYIRMFAKKWYMPDINSTLLVTHCNVWEYIIFSALIIKFVPI